MSGLLLPLITSYLAETCSFIICVLKTKWGEITWSNCYDVWPIVVRKIVSKWLKLAPYRQVVSHAVEVKFLNLQSVASNWRHLKWEATGLPISPPQKLPNFLCCFYGLQLAQTQTEPVVVRFKLCLGKLKHNL